MKFQQFTPNQRTGCETPQAIELKEGMEGVLCGACVVLQHGRNIYIYKCELYTHMNTHTQRERPENKHMPKHPSVEKTVFCTSYLPSWEWKSAKDAEKY